MLLNRSCYGSEGINEQISLLPLRGSLLGFMFEQQGSGFE